MGAMVTPSAFLAAALWLAAASVAAQSRFADPLVSDRVDVRWIEVDAVVTDNRDRRVTGLARDDFELLLDGRPLSIVSFAALEASAAEGARPLVLAIGELGLAGHAEGRFERPGDGDEDGVVLVDRLLLGDHGQGLERDCQPFAEEISGGRARIQ